MSANESGVEANEYGPEVAANQVINQHVELLNAYQPFDPDFSGIFFESSNLQLDLRTLASNSLRGAVDEPACRVVVLTGDAGHGKTHLCGQLLADLTGKPLDPKLAAELADGGNANTDLAECGGGRSLRVIKDLSESSPETGAELLSAAFDATNRVTVICANEGRLRSAAGSAGLSRVIDALDDSILAGQSRSADGSITILNLNHQSVAAVNRADNNIFRQLMAAWVGSPDAWAACGACPAREHCPILANRSALAENLDDRPVGGIELLLRTAERTGHVVTIRELLIFVAHLVTGGLRCRSVHQRVDQDGTSGWQWEYLFHEVAFGDRVPADARRALDVFAGMSKIDPARRALRPVDSRLDPNIGSGFDPLFHTVSESTPTTVAAKRKEKRDQVRMWRFLRRHDFFCPAHHQPGAEVPSQEDRLGLHHVAAFESIMAGEPLPRVRNLLLRGLEAVQGIHRSGVHSFVLADPALAGSGSGAVIVADTVSLNQVQLLSERNAWIGRAQPSLQPDVHERVDWIDRQIVLSFAGADAPANRSLALSLYEFEFVLRAATGLRSNSFFAPEVRRFMSRLATMVEPVDSADTMTLIVGDRQRTLMIDDGTLVEVNG